MAQRLIRKLCDACKVKVSSFDEDMLKSASIDVDELKKHTVYAAKGCEKCGGTGYKGRLAIHEALYFTKEIRQIIVRSGVEVDEEKIREQAKKDGSLSLRDSGIEKVILGQSSVEEVLASTTEG
jgi:type IV pilus assembly protein PilB